MIFSFSLSLPETVLPRVVHFEEFQQEDLEDPALSHMLQSFRYVRCAYTHFDVPSHHALHALRTSVVFYGRSTLQCLVEFMGAMSFNSKFLSFSGLGHVTSDKQIPSALEYFGHFKNAVSLEKRLLKPGASKALRDILNLLAAQYNKMTTNKKHRIDTAKRALIYNTFLSQ